MPSIFCPHCDAELRVKSTAIGNKIRCPECDKSFVADDADDAGDVEVVRSRKGRAAAPSSARSGMKMPSCLTGCFMLFGLVAVVSCLGVVMSSRQQGADLEQAGKLYDAGKIEEAVSKYKS